MIPKIVTYEVRWTEPIPTKFGDSMVRVPEPDLATFVAILRLNGVEKFDFQLEPPR